VVVFGWEPGGGVDARCQRTSTDLERSLFFFDGETGDELGRFVFTRFQGPTENCTLHNYNVVPLRSGKYVLVHGSYQAGTGVVDFTDLANAKEIAWSDPDPLPTVPEFPFFCGGRAGPRQSASLTPSSGRGVSSDLGRRNNTPDHVSLAC
jgi:hypothetical protein